MGAMVTPTTTEGPQYAEMDPSVDLLDRKLLFLYLYAPLRSFNIVNLAVHIIQLHWETVQPCHINMNNQTWFSKYNSLKHNNITTGQSLLLLIPGVSMKTSVRLEIIAT